MITVKCPNCDCIIHVDTTSKPMTNADRIRSMTDEELAEQLAFSGCPPCCFNKDGTLGACPAGRLPSKRDCKDCWLDWLKQEATND